VLERATFKALELAHKYIGTEHILLGLLLPLPPKSNQYGDDRYKAAEILYELGISLGGARQEVLNLIAPENTKLLSGHHRASYNGVDLGETNDVRVEPPQPMSPSRVAILGAVARGWCHDKNTGKTMDKELAIAIADEVEKIMKPPQI
jgi:ATP-dependent Clp protease ATP-binding subunit ClpC